MADEDGPADSPDTEPSEEDLDALMQLFGRTMYQVQVLEYAVVSLLGASFDLLGREHPRELMVERFGDTYGRLLKYLDDIDIDGHLAERLRAMKGLRNELVHRFYRYFAPLGVSTAVLNSAGRYLATAQGVLEDTTEQVWSEVERRLIALHPDGWTLEEGRNRAIEAYRREMERGERPHDLW